MKNEILSRQQLESMTTADLIHVADEYGIDIPEGLDRRFIIGEILEAFEDLEEDEIPSEDEISAEENHEKGKKQEQPETLPETYNNTCIDAVLRNPAWIFVFWDVRESDVQLVEGNPNFDSSFLRVSFYEDKSAENSSYFFDVKIPLSTSEQYIMIPGGKKFVKIDLSVMLKDKVCINLASTHVMEIPSGSERIKNMQPGEHVEFPPLVELSGMKKIMHDHFLNHRQSFYN
jgi:hypothetical protein